MRLYLSGSVGVETDEYIVDSGMPRLFTFAYPDEPIPFLRYADAQGIQCDVMLDSGAFTAWNKGRPVELSELLRWHDRLRESHPNHKYSIIALDVIPGTREEEATERDIASAMEESLDNLDTMIQHHGRSTVMPVYHSGEPLWFRDELLAKSSRLCLSMNQNLAESRRVTWATAVWPGAGDIHGLAATGTTMMERVPWDSVDSAGWMMVGAMGSILWPSAGGAKMTPLAVSADSPARKMAGRHLDTRGDKRALLSMIADRGYDVEALRTDYVTRWKWNIDIWKEYTPITRHTHTLGLFP